MAYYPANSGEVFVVDAASARHWIGDFQSLSSAPDEATTETETSLSKIIGTRTTTGSGGPGRVSIAYRPYLAFKAHRELVKSFRDESLSEVVHVTGVAKSLRDNAVAANTLAIAADGTLTAAGGIEFGSQDEPESPWNQGLGIVIGTVLYVIEDITGAQAGVVSRFGEIVSGFAEEDEVALANVAATQSWELVQMGIEESFQGRVSLAGGKEYAGTTVSSSVNVILSSFPSEKLSVPV